ncbi:hypothetical protein BB558_003695 [Smittium angustum]|nr:hypothetical protein BB558_003695 [Smittium angustum]
MYDYQKYNFWKRDKNYYFKKRRRPPFSYSIIIALAILSTEEKKMSLKDIYNWIKKNYPKVFEGSDIGWQNTIRHNLSLNSFFRRMPRYEVGTDSGGRYYNKKGSFWTIDLDKMDKTTKDKVFGILESTKNQHSQQTTSQPLPKTPFNGKPQSQINGVGYMNNAKPYNIEYPEYKNYSGNNTPEYLRIIKSPIDTIEDINGVSKTIKCSLSLESSPSNKNNKMHPSIYSEPLNLFQNFVIRRNNTLSEVQNYNNSRVNESRMNYGGEMHNGKLASAPETRSHQGGLGLYNFDLRKESFDTNNVFCHAGNFGRDGYGINRNARYTISDVTPTTFQNNNQTMFSKRTRSANNWFGSPPFYMNTDKFGYGHTGTNMISGVPGNQYENQSYHAAKRHRNMFGQVSSFEKLGNNKSPTIHSMPNTMQRSVPFMQNSDRGYINPVYLCHQGTPKPANKNISAADVNKANKSGQRYTSEQTKVYGEEEDIPNGGEVIEDGSDSLSLKHSIKHLLN